MHSLSRLPYFCLCVFFSVMTLPIALHSLLMVVYSSVLLFAQGPAIFDSMTTNEQFNGWRYKYMIVRDVATGGELGQGGKITSTPFDEGKWKNALAFFKLRKAKYVPATVAMAQTPDEAVVKSAAQVQAAAAALAGNSSGGGAQLAEAAFDWDGIEHLQQGIIVTPENEAQAYGVMRYLKFQKILALSGGKPSPPDPRHAHGGGSGSGHGHSHGGNSGGGGHGHSHGGKECQGH
jgi:hypothetical protein